MKDFNEETDLNDVIKCTLNLTKKEMVIFEFFKLNNDDYYTTEDLSREINLDLSTVQRGVKKMALLKIIERKQNNLENGSYLFLYKCKTKADIKFVILERFFEWSAKTKDKLRRLDNV